MISCGGFSTQPVTVAHLSTRGVDRDRGGIGRPDHVYL